MSGFPYLLVLMFWPVLGAIVVAVIARGGDQRGGNQRTAKLTAVAFSLVEFVVAVGSWIHFVQWQNQGYWTAYAPITDGPTPPVPSSALFDQTVSVDWIPSFGIRFSLGVDGISLVMIALIALLVPIVLGASWEERLPAGRSQGGYFALVLGLQGAMVGVFAATDVFLFYVMFEVMLIPMYFLIGRFGGPRRTFAAMKFFLYSLLGGLLMLASLIGLYVASGRVLGEGTLDFATLRSIANDIPESTQLWIFAGFAVAFAIKAPLVPLHTWLPDAGAEAPTGAGTLLVGVLDKVGTFGFLRICLPLLPAASSRLAWLIILLAVLGIVYGAIVAAGQTDLKRFVTYTSIAHFGFIAMGVFAFTTSSISGAVLYMVNHGIATGLLFLLVGMLTARGGSRSIADYGGVWKVAPVLGGLFLVASLATIAVPGTNSFISEFLVLLGTFTRHPAWAVVATVGIVLAAAYMLWVFQKVMTGPIRGAAVLGGERLVHGPAPHGPALDATHPTGSPRHPEPADGSGPGGGASAALGVVTAPGRVSTPHSGAVGLADQAIPERHGVRVRFGDLKAREIAVLSPLVGLIILLGVYPQPVLDVINPTAERTVSDSGHSDPAPPLGEEGSR
ncbi:NADH-quinone oxidoreductase subunit M [Nakamurella flavida]|uniref:NADH-quinone oxidoreductase subunit M n=1 Tax=Nakamurella flavida TaxID=363630 RepID=A0A938YIN8_9ACTN|nr:NADH-quinone oxidoreductase subunit M [Nakamurella flavida]MBM9475824.1 NADH-quinone oxidoreductase subunit M [Nakamurella flavida]MDP9777893.1 NADH-quinone oxidoreductase subunit M [Nakamurella flavida]